MIDEIMLDIDREIYRYQTLNGKSMIEWAVEWFRTDNDTFFELYGFNFNPHEYRNLYQIAREVVYPDER